MSEFRADVVHGEGGQSCSRFHTLDSQLLKNRVHDARDDDASHVRNIVGSVDRENHAWVCGGKEGGQR